MTVQIMTISIIKLIMMVVKIQNIKSMWWTKNNEINEFRNFNLE